MKEKKRFKLLLGDNIESLKKLPDKKQVELIESFKETTWEEYKKLIKK